MRNDKYWANRMRILEESLLDTGYEYTKNLERQYATAIQDIESQIARWYQRFAAENGITLAEANKLLTTQELDEFRWTVEEYIKYGQENAVSQAWLKQLKNASARVHVSRLDSLKLQLQQQAEVLHGAQSEALNSSLNEVYSRGYYHTAYELQKGIGVGWTLHGLTDSSIRKVLSRPWTLDGQTFSDRIWSNKESLVNTVNTQLTQMIMRGAAPDKAIKAISDRFKVSKSQAGRLVMTESAAFANEARRDCFKDLGVERYRIIGTLDGETCSLCGSLDNKVYPMSEYRVGLTAPPFHPWCRCTTAPYYEDMEEIGDRFARDGEGKGYNVPRDMNYQSWETYNKAVAHETKITAALRTMADKTGHELSGLEYRLKTPESFTRKVNKEAAEYLELNPGATYEDAYRYATSRMYDTVRYTALADSEKFTKSYNKAVYNLKKTGYNIGRVKNSLPDTDAPYRGVNTVITTPDGFNFELQFHTPESLEVKNKTHLLYEEARKTTTSPERRKELDAEMKALTRGLKTPEGAETIIPMDNLKGR